MSYTVQYSISNCKLQHTVSCPILSSTESSVSLR